MKTATGLAVIAVGAILALAVRADTPGIDINLVGVIMMVTGVAGLLLRPRTSGWLRRRIVLGGNRGGRRGGRITESSGAHLVEDPKAIVDDPALLAAEVLAGADLDAADASPGTKPPASVG